VEVKAKDGESTSLTPSGPAAAVFGAGKGMAADALRSPVGTIDPGMEIV
jgi:hypothetical protein